MSKLESFIFIFLCFFFVTCYESAAVKLNELTSKYIGKNGTFSIKATPDEPELFREDKTRETSFKTWIYKGDKGTEVDCGLWKPSISKLFVFCMINADIPPGNYSISFSGIKSFNYQGYSIYFSGEFNFEFEKIDKDLIDLYSGKQIINIVEGKDSYDVKFNIVSYNQELLMLRTLGYIFMVCGQNNTELICKIGKNDLEKGLIDNNFPVDVCYSSDTAESGIVELPLVGNIIITAQYIQKTDVFVGITRLLENVAEGYSTSFAYETNVTNIKNAIASVHLNFENEYYTDSAECIIKKYDENPLLIICPALSIGKCWLKEIKEERINTVGNIRYNFRIQPVKNEEKIYNSKNDKGAFIKWLYPEILDFTKMDTLYIDYDSGNTSHLKGITFNSDKEDLNCQKIPNGLLRCTVPKNHFEGKKSGYYFTRHTNHLDGKSTNYEGSPVKVILKNNYYSISLYYLLLLILIMF